MTVIQDIVGFLEDISLWGRNGLDYLYALILLLGIMIVFYVLKFIFIGRFEKYLSKREGLARVQVLVGGLKKVLGIRTAIVFSLYVSINSLEPSPVVNNTLRFVLLFIVTYFLLQFSFLVVDYFIEFRTKIQPESTNILEFFRLALKTTLFVIISLWFLSNLGVNTDVFVASIGVFSLAIAFSLQNVISDIFAAMTIYLDKPIEIGDTIMIGGEMGTVERIGIRSTRLRTLAGHMLIVSNRDIISTRINNYQKMEKRRVAFTLGVHCNTSTYVLREIQVLMEDIITSIPNTQFDRTYLTNLGKFTYDFEVVYFVLSRSYTQYLETHEQVTLKIIEVFKERNIEIPYPTQSLLLEKAPEGVN